MIPTVAPLKADDLDKGTRIIRVIRLIKVGADTPCDMLARAYYT